jgi:YggT family protein
MVGLLLTIINFVYWAFLILFIARMIFGFARVSPYDPTWGPLMRFVIQTTEPILEPIRRVIPPAGGLDFSPLVVLVGLSILQRLIISIF